MSNSSEVVVDFCTHDSGDDYDKDPAELDQGADDFDFAEPVDSALGTCQLVVTNVGSTALLHTNIDQDDDNPKYGHPSGDGHGGRPEHQHSVDSLELVRDGDEVIKPIGPSDGEASSRIDEFGRPLHEGGW
jgi:hypothetical protein